MGDNQLNTVDQLLYQVPNFSTKLYLLEMLLADKEVFDKVVVFVNSRFTAETVYKNLAKDFNDEVAVFRASEIADQVVNSLSDFRLTPKLRILIIANEDVSDVNVSEFPCIMHFDIPEDEMAYTQRVLFRENTLPDQLALTFCTDLELTTVRRLEQIQGKKMQVMDLPEELFIVKENDKGKSTEKDSSFDAGEAMKIRKRN